MMAACYKNGNDNNKANNNENKVCLLLRRWGLVGYILDHVLDHVLDYMLDQMLDYIIIGLIVTVLQLYSFLM